MADSLSEAGPVHLELHHCNCHCIALDVRPIEDYVFCGYQLGSSPKSLGSRTARTFCRFSFSDYMLDMCECSQHEWACGQSFGELDFDRGLWRAALEGDVDRLKQLLDRGTPVNQQDNFGYTALHYACRHNQRDCCQLLLARGADPNAQTKGGLVTPLHRAAYIGSVEIVKLLFKYDANPLLQDSDGCTALHKASEMSHHSIGDLLLTVAPTLSSVRNNRGCLPGSSL